MNLKQAFKMAIKSIMASKMRTFLTMLGIIIGVCAVIVLVSVVQGSTGSISDSIESLGANSISVSFTGRNSTKYVTYEEMQEFQSENAEYISYVVPMMSGMGRVKYDSSNITVSVTGTNEDYLSVKNREVTSGRFINGIDIEKRRKVAVIGSYNVQELFGFEDPINKQIKINNEIFTVVGVLNEISDSEEMSEDNVIIIPYTSGRLIFRTNRIRSYTVWASTAENVETATDMVNNFLYSKFKDEDEYNVVSVASMMDALDEITGMMALLTAGIAGISLVVGGIGIMNIMLVSVTERTREIGIRKAIGAKRSSILSQFLIESALVSCMGGVVGIILSIIGTSILGNAMSINAFPSVFVMLGAFAFSAVIGIFFGWAPANKAAKLNPIDALHAE
ncbi:MAG: FtsX-like permease family protein [Ruminococcaceae bacterium]|nr:FtsX-like permease family protein [Oscillospiraceae bacterium]